MVQFFTLIKTILDYLFTMFTLPLLVVDQLNTFFYTLSSTTGLIHPDIAAFAVPEMSIILILSLLLPLFRDVF